MGVGERDESRKKGSDLIESDISRCMGLGVEGMGVGSLVVVQRGDVGANHFQFLRTGHIGMWIWVKNTSIHIQKTDSNKYKNANKT